MQFGDVDRPDGKAMVDLKPRTAKPLSAIQRYGLAVVSTAVALGGALFTQRFHIRSVEIPSFLFALAVSAWYGGSGPAVLALVLSTMSFDYFFTEPLHTHIISVGDLPYFIVFT